MPSEVVKLLPFLYRISTVDDILELSDQSV